MAAVLAGAPAASAAPDPHPVQGGLSAFMGEPRFSRQRLFGDGKGNNRGGYNIVTARDGAVPAFDDSLVRGSTGGGATWRKPVTLDWTTNGCNAVVDEVTGAN